MLAVVQQTKVCSSCKLPKDLESFGAHRRGLFGRKSECKKCLSDKETARRAADPEAARAYKRDWWAAKEHSSEERQQAAQRARDWYQDNKGRRLVSFHLWKVRHPEAFKAIQKRYLVKNPVHVRRRAYMQKVVRTFTAQQWAETLALFDHRCAYCLRNDLPMTQDHVIPVSKGGDHTQENVVPACKPCNSRKLNRPVWVMSNVKETSYGTPC